MYYPILRGKQYELLAIRECSNIFSQNGTITPIIEPVKENPRDLLSCINLLNEEGVDHILICNPTCGFFSNNHRQLWRLVDEIKSFSDTTSFAYWIHEGTSLEEIEIFLEKIENHTFSLIHNSAYSAPIELFSLSQRANFSNHIFIESGTSRRYQQQFNDFSRIVIQDNFQRQRRNADYSETPDEFFSDQHLTFADDGLSGFGDFSIIGNHFSESGGRAYTAAIHLTHEKETTSEIWIRHFISNTDTTDPVVAELIIEALEETIEFIDQNPAMLDYSTACRELKDIYETGRATTLGYIKKLSIKHHFELITRLLSN